MKMGNCSFKNNFNTASQTPIKQMINQNSDLTRNVRNIILYRNLSLSSE